MKSCSICKEVLPLEMFARKGKSSTGKQIYQSQCRSCQKSYAKQHYEQNQAKYSANARRTQSQYRKQAKDFVASYLMVNHCVDCGESNPVVLEFDHVRGIKLTEVSKLMGSKSQSTLAALIEEIAKCDVRCANCHRIVTHSRRQALIA